MFPLIKWEIIASNEPIDVIRSAKLISIFYKILLISY